MGSPYGLSVVKFVLAVALVQLFCPAPLHAAEDRPLSLDATNATRSEGPMLAPYMKALRQTIESRWRPFGTGCNSEATVSFEINETGDLLRPQITKTSGNQDFDNASQAAVAASGPFSALPAITTRTLFVKAEFNGKLLPKPTAKRFQPQQYQQQYSAPQTGNQYGYQPTASDGYSQYNRIPTAQQAGMPLKSAYQVPQQPPTEATQYQTPSSTESNDTSAIAQASSLGAGSAGFKLIPVSKLKFYTDEQVSAYLIQLEEWLKIPPTETPAL